MPERHLSPNRIAIVARYIPSGIIAFALLYSSIAMATYGGAPLSALFLFCGAVPAVLFARHPSLLKLLALIVLIYAAIWIAPPYDMYGRISVIPFP